MFGYNCKKVQLVARDSLSSGPSGSPRYYYVDESVWDDGPATREVYAYVRAFGRSGSGSAQFCIMGELGVGTSAWLEFADTPGTAKKIIDWTNATEGLYIGEQTNTFNFGPKTRYAIGIKDYGGAATCTADIEAWLILRG